MTHLPLRDRHAAWGASFGADGELPLHYGDPRAEYRAAREAAALADVSDLGKTVFHGPDRTDFLHGLLTADVKNLAPGRGTPACLLTNKGKLVADLWLFHREEDHLALHAPQAGALLSAALAKYLPLSDTLLEDAGDGLGAFFLIGPRAPEALAPLGMPCPTPGTGVSIMWEGYALFLAACSLLGPEGVLLLFPLAAGASLWEALLRSAAPLGREALETLRVEAGAPLLGVDVDAENYPVEANLERAIDYEKGCYLGQETIARLKYHGRPPRRLAGLATAARPAPGAEVTAAGQVVGRVTSTVDSPRLGAALSLALVKYDAREGLRVRWDGREEEARVVPLPLE